MAQREAVMALAADLSGLVDRRCREEGVTESTQRLATANHVMNEFAVLAKKLSRNLEDHGEITPRAYRELKETVRDLAANVLGRPDVPRTEAATSFVAD
jgi:hypothetical protein